MTDTSQILLNQARSTTPPSLAVPLVALVLVTVVVRLYVIRSGRPSLLLNALISVAAIIVLLRDPHIQNLFLSFGINLATVRVLCHTVVVFGAAVAWFLARAWMTSQKFHRLEMTFVFGSALALSVWLWWVSSPARASNIAMEDLESWRTAAYLLPVSTPVPVACIAIIAAVVAHGRERNELWTWIWTAAAIMAATLQAVDHVTRAVSGVFLSRGAHNLLTQIRTEGVDQIFLPAVAALALCTLPAIWSTLRTRATLQANADAMHSMWSAIVGRVPGISKPETKDLPLEFRVEEMFIEIEDGLIRLSLPTHCSSPKEAARHVHDGLRNYRDGDSPFDPPSWLADRAAILKAAASFKDRSSEKSSMK